MADQIFTVRSGFYDALDSDRVYSADDMNRPYKRVVSNGVFATPKGIPSTDLQVVAAGSGMQIIVKAGEGIFGDKWFENPSDINITVPVNTNTVPRIDSVIVQIDKRIGGREGNIVYRTGTPSSRPSAPAINTVTNVIEYRLANIRVEASADTITAGVITDRRGSADCPWVTSLIYQVDTSTLYDQYKAAYDEYFEKEKEQWDNWYAHLTEELNVSMSLVKITNTVVTTEESRDIPIGIQEYDQYSDTLEVYVNGLKLSEDQYAIGSTGTYISLAAPIKSGQTIEFVVFASVIMTGGYDIMFEISELTRRLDELSAINDVILTPSSGVTVVRSRCTMSGRTVTLSCVFTTSAEIATNTHLFHVSSSDALVDTPVDFILVDSTGGVNLAVVTSSGYIDTSNAMDLSAGTYTMNVSWQV